MISARIDPKCDNDQRAARDPAGYERQQDTTDRRESVQSVRSDSHRAARHPETELYELIDPSQPQTDPHGALTCHKHRRVFVTALGATQPPSPTARCELPSTYRERRPHQRRYLCRDHAPVT